MEEDKKEPILNFVNEKETWGWMDTERAIPLQDHFKEENKICKVQNIKDLREINRILDNLRYKKNYINYNIGNKSYLFEEDGEIKIKTMKDYVTFKKFDTKFGLIKCTNSGEFGGSLTIIHSDGRISVFYSFVYSFEYLFEYDKKVYVISTLDHLGGYECGLHELRKCNDKYELITIFESDWDLDFAGYYVEENYIYFYSNSYDYDGLYCFDIKTNELKTIHRDLCKKIIINDLLKKDNFIYIYGNYNLIKYDLNTNKIESIYTNLEFNEISEFWLVDENTKLLDIWDKILI